MKVTILIILLCISLCNLAFGAIYPVTKLYHRPDGTSQVVFVLPFFFKVWVGEVRVYDECIWANLIIKVNFLGNKYDIDGWVYAPR